MEHSYTVLKLKGWELMQCKPNFIIELVSSRLAPFQLQAKFCHVPLQLWLNLIFLASKAWNVFESFGSLANFFFFRKFWNPSPGFFAPRKQIWSQDATFYENVIFTGKRAQSKFRVWAVGRLGLESRRCLVTGTHLWQLRGQFQLS